MLKKIVAVFCVLTIPHIYGQKTTICQTTFLTQFYSCIQKMNLIPQNILWFAKNGTIGSKPVNEATFGAAACRARQQILECSSDAMNKIVASTACAEKDKQSIKNFFGSIFGPYDEKCAHPCRWTLLKAFKRCHDSIGVTSGPFLTNERSAAVIGSNQTETAFFCKNRAQLFMCMINEKARCPEADFIMRQVGLDLSVMKESTDILCSQPKVYLDSILCYSKLSAEVQNCHTRAQSKMTELLSKFQIIINENEFNRQFCSIRQETVSCDLMVWNNSRDADKCNKAVVGLRTEYGCKLLPRQCMRISLSQMRTICSSDKFMTAARKSYRSSASTFTSAVTSASALWVVGALALLRIS